MHLQLQSIPSFKAEAKQDSVITHQAHKLWGKNEEEPLQRYVLWRFIATRNGVFRLYPAVQIPKQYDPYFSTW